jgi:hypothetical protein
MSSPLENQPKPDYISEQDAGGGIGPILPAPVALDEEKLKDVLPGVTGPTLRLAVAIAQRACAKLGMSDPTEPEILAMLKDGWADWLPMLTKKVIARGELEL